MTDLTQLKLFATNPHECSYLEDREATTVFVDPATEMNVDLYSGLSEYGFRRSGSHIYRPHCGDCSACISARVPVHSFRPSRSQRRCINTNQDLKITATQNPNTDEHYDLYERYISARHADGDMYPPTQKQYEDFLNNPLGCTYYLEMREDQTLIGCAVSDQLDSGLSAIYTYFDPNEQARSLGKFAILHQISRAQQLGLDYVFLGYWIRDCEKMSYKSDYRPIELLINQQWVTAK